ncbi:SAM-dependent methyltransferase [Slackia isoflavoniconvertens]|uniref:SAM-dependent methyltransferase n=1 Tax=Slackia isoflavoniconvertens TaxID=572010 RepID=UPI001C6A5055|nr:tRNA (N6-threonylcarbamoyladenosine(37)-N6)-methyltransferase TrmO [Slackia isoflavoniconvertens]
MNDGDGAAQATVVATDVYRVAADDDSCCAVVYDDDLSTGDPSVRAAVQPAARSWSPTVRPPRLGGAQRVGVFATRSPFRPNPIGLTCVKIDRVELTDAGPIIHVLGADLRDGTPIFDIKPYILFADCHPDATGCFIDAVPWRELDVNFPESLQAQVPPAKLLGLIEVLRQDPRRAGSEHEPARVYHLAYAGLDVAFTVDGETLHVVCVG